MAQINKGWTYTNGDQVTATNLNGLVDAATLLAGAITEQGVLSGSVEGADTILVYDSSVSNLRKLTVENLLKNITTDSITGPTTANLTVTAGTGRELVINGTTVRTTNNFVASANCYLGGASQVVEITGTTNTITGATSIVGALTVSSSVTVASAPGSPTQLANKAYVDGTISKNANGYAVLPSGLVIQWGETATLSADSATNAITFPTSFNAACVSVVVTPSTDNGIASGGSSGKYSGAATARTTGGFNLINDGNSTKFTWIALGY